MAVELHCEKLVQLPIPDLITSQLQRFTRESLLARCSGTFSVTQALSSLQQADGQKILAFDFGGTALKACPAIVQNGAVHFIERDEIVVPVEGSQADKGHNLVGALYQIRDQTGHMPVGVSVAGIVDQGALVDSPNLPAFTTDLKKAGGFNGIFGGRVAIYNDAAAGLIAGAVGAAQAGNDKRRIIYLINGGGIGAAVLLKDGSVISLEPGHIEIVPELNPRNVKTPCGLLGNTHVCLERVGAMGAGVEAQWELATGTRLTGKQIAERMYSGDYLAQSLLERSTNVTAHEIEGIRQALDLKPAKTLVIAHGGAFKTAGYLSRVRHILNKHHQPKDMEVISTSSLGISNACLTGAAIGAATLLC